MVLIADIDSMSVVFCDADSIIRGVICKYISFPLFCIKNYMSIISAKSSAIMQACCVEYIILESDNLSSLFPNAHLNFGAFDLNAHHLFALMTALAVLPTVWLRDLSILSYISGKHQ